MKRVVSILFITAFLLPATSAQELWRLRRYEVTASVGTAHYFGDIGGYSQGENAGGLKDFNIKNTQPAYQVAVKYRLYEELKIEAGFTFGSLKGNDLGGVNENREYEFTTRISEPKITAEYYFVVNQRENRYQYQFGGQRGGFTWLPSTFYAFSGIGGVIFSVSPNESLQIRSEKTNGIALAVPLGLGIGYDISPYWGFGLRIGARFTTSDYLDALSTQWSNARDIYYFAGLTVKYKLATASNGLPSFRRDRR